MKEFLIEIYSEEIPANFQLPAEKNFKELICNKLDYFKLKYGEVDSFVTPRRLALRINSLDSSQEDNIEEKKGPSIDASDKALNGFLKSIGKNKKDLITKKIKKGEFYFASIETKGKLTKELLSETLPEILSKVFWPKSMKWGNDSVRWVRPIRSILCLYGNEIVDFNFGKTRSSDFTFGHRSFSKKIIKISNFNEYKSKLYEHKVIIDHEERRESILSQSKAAALSEGLRLTNDKKLFSELAGLVEWPVALVGSIDSKFMNLPSEVLQVSIRSHQKYLSLFLDRNIASKFILISNLFIKESNQTVIHGNERVLRARLADANFFYNNDSKKGLGYFVNNLSKIVFHRDLGTMNLKVERMKLLSEKIYALNFNGPTSLAIKAAELCKADLLSETVIEFPELQGVIGGYLAKIDGHSSEVSEAIRGHYSPLGPSDVCPSKPTTVSIALADKIDTLVGFYIAGERSTGSGDQFGLRRSALGIIRIIIENHLEMDLSSIILDSINFYKKQGIVSNSDEIFDQIQQFISSRLVSFLKKKGVKHDIVSAVLPFFGANNISTIIPRIDALISFVNSNDGQNLLGGYKRASNILSIEEKRDLCIYKEEPTNRLFQSKEEGDLYFVLNEVSENLGTYLDKAKFNDSMKELSRLKKPIDNFFEFVKVNSPDKLVRKNRLELLAKIRNTFNKVSDFSKIDS